MTRAARAPSDWSSLAGRAHWGGWMIAASLSAGLLIAAGLQAQALLTSAGDAAGVAQAVLIELPPAAPALLAVASPPPPTPAAAPAPMAAPTAEDAPALPPADAAPQIPAPAPRLAPAPDAAPPAVSAPPPKPVAKAAPEPPAKAEAPAVAPKAKVAAPKAAKAPTPAPAAAPAEAKAAPIPKGRQQSLLKSWGGSIRARIQRAQTSGNGKGSVTLALTVSNTGALLGVSIAKSSGNPALDQAALAAVQAAGRFKPAPDGLDAASYDFTLPITFKG